MLPFSHEETRRQLWQKYSHNIKANDTPIFAEDPDEDINTKTFRVGARSLYEENA